MENVISEHFRQSKFSPSFDGKQNHEFLMMSFSFGVVRREESNKIYIIFAQCAAIPNDSDIFGCWLLNILTSLSPISSCPQTIAPLKKEKYTGG